MSVQQQILVQGLRPSPGHCIVVTRVVGLLLFLSVILTPAAAQELGRYETQYYMLFTDVPAEQAREAALRMTRMAEEYHQRTRDFSGVIRHKFPFYLYRNREDYLANGGIPGSAGFFKGSELRAFGGDRLDDRTWHTVQHEGFHQFAHAVIGGQRPMWVNEGLAEYFGEALFTGNGYISGIIPPWRLKRVRQQFLDGKFLPIEQIMSISNKEWNAQLEVSRYDQVWAMTHFLAHGDNGRYRKAFGAFMVDLSRGQQADRAWLDRFGSTDGFEQRWTAWWMGLNDDPTAELYAQATVARLTAFLARAAAQRQSFATWNDFVTAAREKQLRMPENDWLPQTLLDQALLEANELSESGAKWALQPAAPQLQCVLKDGTTISGSYQLRNNRITRAEAKLEPRR